MLQNYSLTNRNWICGIESGKIIIASFYSHSKYMYAFEFGTLEYSKTSSIRLIKVDGGSVIMANNDVVIFGRTR